MRHNIFSDVLNEYVFRILFIITQNVYLYTPVFSNVHSISPYFPVFSPRITTFISCSQLYFNYLHKLPALHWSSHRKCSIEICVLENFTKFTGKHLCQSLFFNKVAGLRLSTLLKKRLWHKCFTVNFVKFLKTPFFTEHLQWLPLVIPFLRICRYHISCYKMFFIGMLFIIYFLLFIYHYLFSVEVCYI